MLFEHDGGEPGGSQDVLGLDANSAQDGIAMAAGIERDEVRPIAGFGRLRNCDRT